MRAAARNYRLASVLSALSKLLDQYPVTEVATAVAEALQHDVPHPNAVRNILDRRRRARGAAPPMVVLPDHLKQRDVRVRVHPLATYDQLKERAHGDPEDPDESA